MEHRTIKTLSDLMGGANTGRIKNLLDGKVVRKLMVEGQFIIVDALTEAVTVPLDTEIAYEAWFWDRGSFVFKLPTGGVAKLCTEADILEVNNQMNPFSILPAEGIRKVEQGQEW